MDELEIINKFILDFMGYEEDTPHSNDGQIVTANMMYNAAGKYVKKNKTK